MRLAAFFGLAGVVLAQRTTPPEGALTVGSEGGYSTIQEAVNALDSTSTEEQIIFIVPGTYEEQVLIENLSGPLTIYGYTTHPMSYHANQVTISHSGSQASGSASNDETATLRAETENFKLYNVNLVNTYGEGSQALAVSANAGNQGYYGCNFVSFQDTVLAETGTQLFARSRIEGATDFIFGQRAQAWFDQVDIRIPTTSLGYIVASGRSEDDSSYYVINNSTVAAKFDADVPAGSMYLGRPWGDYARVTFQDTMLGAVINSAGWHIWNEGDERTDHVSFTETGNSGKGASGSRASFSSKLDGPVAIADILGGDYASAAYVDTSYLS